ncbi:MAG: EscU/YscU/HrcU family type III secretion system export apparatus switch protein [Alphaproteobacteria bacterium]
MKRKTPMPVAVALTYKQGTDNAPRVTAKGQGKVAEKIVALARENDIVIESDPFLAQALSGVELDQNIPPELFEAVAQVIGFILRTRGRLD